MDEHVEGKLQTAVINLMKTLRGNVVFVAQMEEQLKIPADSLRKVLSRLMKMGHVRKHGNGWMYPGVQEVGENDDENELSA